MNILHLLWTALGQILKGEPPAAATYWSLLVVRTDLLPPSCSISHFVLVISPTHDHSALTLVGQAGNIDKTIICLLFIWFSISITDWRRQKEKIAALIFFSFSTLQQEGCRLWWDAWVTWSQRSALALGTMLLCKRFQASWTICELSSFFTWVNSSHFKSKKTRGFCVQLLKMLLTCTTSSMLEPLLTWGKHWCDLHSGGQRTQRS